MRGICPIVSLQTTKKIHSSSPGSLAILRDSGLKVAVSCAYNTCLHCRLYFSSRYVQGMNELVAVIYFLFCKDSLVSSTATEADTFYCFSILMAEQRDCFLKSLDHSESGMHGRISQLNQLLKALDFQIWRKLEQNGVDPTFYSLRWIMLLLSQELSMQDTIRLWDSLLHDPSPNALISIARFSGTLCPQTTSVDGIMKGENSVKIISPQHDNLLLEMQDEKSDSGGAARLSTTICPALKIPGDAGMLAGPDNSTKLTTMDGKKPDVFDIANDSDEAQSADDKDESSFGMFDKRSYDIRTVHTATAFGKAPPKASQSQSQNSCAPGESEYKQNNLLSGFSAKSCTGGPATPSITPCGSMGTTQKDSLAVRQQGPSTRSHHFVEQDELDDFLPKVQQQPFLHYVCVAMIMRIREVLLAGDFIENMKILQNYPPFYVADTLDIAVNLMRQHELRLRGAAAAKMILNAAGTVISDGVTSAIGAISTMGTTVTKQDWTGAKDKVTQKTNAFVGWLGGKLGGGASGEEGQEG